MQQAEITANFCLGKRLPDNGNEPIFHFQKLNSSSASESNVFSLSYSLEYCLFRRCIVSMDWGLLIPNCLNSLGID